MFIGCWFLLSVLVGEAYFVFMIMIHTGNIIAMAFGTAVACLVLPKLKQIGKVDTEKTAPSALMASRCPVAPQLMLDTRREASARSVITRAFMLVAAVVLVIPPLFASFSTVSIVHHLRTRTTRSKWLAGETEGEEDGNTEWTISMIFTWGLLAIHSGVMYAHRPKTTPSGTRTQLGQQLRQPTWTSLSPETVAVPASVSRSAPFQGDQLARPQTTSAPSIPDPQNQTLFVGRVFRVAQPLLRILGRALFAVDLVSDFLFGLALHGAGKQTFSALVFVFMVLPWIACAFCFSRVFLRFVEQRYGTSSVVAFWTGVLYWLAVWPVLVLCDAMLLTWYAAHSTASTRYFVYYERVRTVFERPGWNQCPR